MAQRLVNVFERVAHSDAQIRRVHRYADGAEGGAIELMVDRLRRGEKVTFSVHWNADRGQGWLRRAWMKPWERRGLTEAEAAAFADKKWALLVAWLENLEPVVCGNGATNAFSAQVAALRR